VTVPNLLSFARLAGVPLFLWLLLGPHADGWALLILVASGLSDWLDGKLARWLDQASDLGAMLDPVADRLYVFSTVLGFAARGLFPWWLAALLIAKDVIITGCLPLLHRAGYAPPAVHYIGKAATFALLYAFPLRLLAQWLDGVGATTAADVVSPIGTAFTVWGSVLYLWTGVLYLTQIGMDLRGGRTTPERVSVESR
jgi:cardiolipin synthase